MKWMVTLFVLVLFLTSTLSVYAGNHEDERQDLQERFEVVKRSFEESREDYFRQRDELVVKVMELRRFCNENLESEECVQLKNEINVHAKTFLESAADSILKLLEKRKVRLEDFRVEIGSSDFENKEELLADLDERIQEVNLRIEMVEELSDQIGGAETKEDLKDLAQNLRDEWKEAEKYLQISGGAVLADRFTGILYKADRLQVKLDQILVRLQSRGYDTSNIESRITDFNSYVAQANQLVEQARDKFNEAKISPDGDTNLVRDGISLLREAHNYLKLAHDELKGILIEVRAAGEPLDEEASEA